MGSLNRPSCPDDLLARTRRIGVSDLERRAIEIHLRGCELCRASEALAAVLAPGVCDRPGDAELITRVAERVSAELTPPARARASAIGSVRGGWRLAAAVAVVCAASAALAWIGTGRSPLRPASPSDPERNRTSAPHHRERKPTAPEPTAGPAPEPAALAPPLRPARATPGIEPSRRQRPPIATAQASPREEATAASLFAKANASRRSGDVDGAIERYRDLRRRYPGAPEARLAAISMADLLLDTRAPERALAAYDAYLAEPTGGSLREEALFGRARALRQLGRSADEAETWRRLLRVSPKSAYEPLARQRLAELGR